MKAAALVLAIGIAVAGIIWGLKTASSATISSASVAEMNSRAQSAVASAVASAEAKTEAEALAKRTVFIGDSYSQGTGASRDSRRWTTLVSSAEGWQEINLALGGTGYLTTASTSGCGKAGCPNYVQMVAKAAAAKPGRVVVAGGQNDFSSDFNDVEPMINKTYADLRAALPKATFIAVGPSVIGDVTPQIVKFDAAVQKAAASVGAQYISLIDPDILNESMAAPDGVHVDDAGHTAIAKAVESKLGPESTR
jgi:lysophospholipase L1-like esterase